MAKDGRRLWLPSSRAHLLCSRSPRTPRRRRISASVTRGHARPSSSRGDLDQMARRGVLAVRRDASWGGSEPKAPDADGHHYDWRCDRRHRGDARRARADLVPDPRLLGAVGRDDPRRPDVRPAARDDRRLRRIRRGVRAAATARTAPSGPSIPSCRGCPSRPTSWATSPTPGCSGASRTRRRRSTPTSTSPPAPRSRPSTATTPVVSAGLLDANAMDPSVFLRRMVRRQPSLRKGIDAVGYHPYQMSYARMRFGIKSLRSHDEVAAGSARCRSRSPRSA